MKHNLRNWKDGRVKIKRDSRKSGEGRRRNRNYCDLCSRKIAKYAHQGSEKVGPSELRLCNSCAQFKRNPENHKNTPENHRLRKWRGQ